MASPTFSKPICSGPLLGVAAVLTEFGVELDHFLGTVSSPKEHFTQPDCHLPISRAAEVLAKGAEVCICPHFGLLAGKSVGLNAFGLSALAAQHQHDLGSALRLLMGHLQYWQAAVVPTLEITSEAVHISYIVGPGANPEIYDCLAAIFTESMRTLQGQHWRPIQILLPRRRPLSERAWRSYFRVVPEFGSERTVITFSAKELLTPLSTANALFGELLKKEIESRNTFLRVRVQDQVERLFSSDLYRLASVEQVAQSIGIHRRTLHRRLAAECTTFAALKDRTRLERAAQLMRNTDLKLVEIATIIGYSDATAFSRAFRRWSGKPPSVWRKSIGSEK